jgi:Phosphoesterase family
MRQAAALLLAAAALLGFRGGASAAVPPIPAFEHVIVVVFENKETSSVLGSRAAPTFFAYFLPIIDDPDRTEQIVPVEELSKDVAARTLPNFALVVPNLCNSMHDCSVGLGDRWLRRTVEPLLHLPRTVIFITFDEGRTSVRGGGHITTLAVGTAVRHRAFTRITNHYGLLRTIEDAWGLPRLGRSAHATPITGIWR